LATIEYLWFRACQMHWN